MKLNKYILPIALAVSALSFSSCNDFLDRHPQGQFTEDDNPGALAEGKVFNIYTMMRNYNITAGIPAFAIEYFRSEDSEKGSTASDGADQAAMYDDFQYNASNGLIKAYWSQNYAVIYQCNDVIETIEKGNLTEENDLRNKVEALFFRAYCYFNLVRAFGEVPLVTFKVNDASEANVPKTTAEEIYKQIDSDLTQAEGLLPRQWQSAYLGRLTWGSARGNNPDILPKVTSLDQTVLRDAIRHERRVELGLESGRFYDLVRWGIASQVLHAAGKTGYQPKNALLPLPQDEIDKSKGVLVQNPDY